MEPLLQEMLDILPLLTLDFKKCPAPPVSPPPQPLTSGRHPVSLPRQAEFIPWVLT